MADPARLFDYDASSPLHLAILAREERDGVEIAEVRYDNGTGGAASAFVVRPAGAGDEALPGVVIAHGGTTPKKHKPKFVDEAVELSRRGTTVLLADTSMPPLGDAAADERATVAAVLVQRRGLDVLASAHGATRLGFYGHSFGGHQGAILAAVEPRLDAIVIAAMGSGIVDRARGEGFSDEAYLQALDRFDPVHWVRVPGRRRLLFQHGRRDEVISLAAGRELYEAAAGPKRWAEYDWGHDLPTDPAARRDRLAFFAEALGPR